MTTPAKTPEALAAALSAIAGVKAANVWEKAENPRVYVDFYSQNNRTALLVGSGRSAQPGKFWVELTPAGAEIKTKYTGFSGAYTREVVEPAIAKVKAAVAAFNQPAAKTAKSVMCRAWAIARAAVAQFGGKVREYLSASLKLAWAE